MADVENYSEMGFRCSKLFSAPLSKSLNELGERKHTFARLRINSSCLQNNFVESDMSSKVGSRRIEAPGELVLGIDLYMYRWTGHMGSGQRG